MGSPLKYRCCRTQITFREYTRYQTMRDKSRAPLLKQRRCFMVGNQVRYCFANKIASQKLTQKTMSPLWHSLWLLEWEVAFLFSTSTSTFTPLFHRPQARCIWIISWSSSRRIQQFPRVNQCFCRISWPLRRYCIYVAFLGCFIASKSDQEVVD